MKWILLALIVAGCSSLRPYDSLTELKSALDTAQGDLATARQKVEELEKQIAQAEISRIQYEIQEFQNNALANLSLSSKEKHSFFSEQREILARIIRNHSNYATDAQQLLDQILTFITEMSDHCRD